jgi:ABC-2 type transport system permease protein
VRFSVRAFRALVVANLRTFLRNPLPSSGLMVVLILLLFGFRALQGLQAQKLNVAVADQAHTASSQRIVADLRRLPAINLIETDAATAASRVAGGTADLELVIPPGIGALDAAGRLLPGQLETSYKTGGAGDQAAALVAAAVDRADRESQSAPQVITIREHLLNPGLGLLQIFLPGLLAFNVINSGLILAAGIFAGYRSGGTLRRIQATGIGPAELVLAHALSNLLLAAVQVLVMLLAAALIFGTLINFGALLAVTMLGYLVFLGIGLAVSGWVRDPQRAPVVASSIAFPLIFLGLFPSSIATGVPGQILALLPVSMATHALRAVVAGSGLGGLGGDLLGLAVWAALALLAAGRVFRWDD